jgi:hypothetical protein
MVSGQLFLGYWLYKNVKFCALRQLLELSPCFRYGSVQKREVFKIVFKVNG